MRRSIVVANESENNLIFLDWTSCSSFGLRLYDQKEGLKNPFHYYKRYAPFTSFSSSSSPFWFSKPQPNSTFPIPMDYTELPEYTVPAATGPIPWLR
ncbi:hypothetical protein QR680_011158 [Steinernema hermaphroditum]|uniref:Uncharacterized protein n=1 Tax=Steinernema hermaphroditum TaxID=289476 RepID=A0AA39MCR2_9BILA|nr:hypothetical protein QR680_011158 [Steinernema hermaphroditum]